MLKICTKERYISFMGKNITKGRALYDKATIIVTKEGELFTVVKDRYCSIKTEEDFNENDFIEIRATDTHHLSNILLSDSSDEDEFCKLFKANGRKIIVNIA